jgi:hypothetical protein
MRSARLLGVSLGAGFIASATMMTSGVAAQETGNTVAAAIEYSSSTQPSSTITMTSTITEFTTIITDQITKTDETVEVETTLAPGDLAGIVTSTTVVGKVVGDGDGNVIGIGGLSLGEFSVICLVYSVSSFGLNKACFKSCFRTPASMNRSIITTIKLCVVGLQD